MGLRFVMAGGGTGGHVVPLLAVARELTRRGHEVVFIGTRTGIEARLAPEAGYPIEWIEIGGLKRVGLARWLKSAWQLPVSIGRAWGILKRLNPGAILSMGGYAAGPVVAAAMLRGTPVVAMEPNAMPGFTARMTARWTWRALVAFEEAAQYFPGRAELTGLPVRPEFFALGPRPAGGKFTVLITGGSRGSRTLNRAFRDSLDRFRHAGVPVRLRHQSGTAEQEECRAALGESGLDGAVSAFIDDMPSAYEAADLIVCRAGAGTVAELAAAGRPAVLVPFPFATDNHQMRNAEAMARAGAARIVEDREMSGERLFEEVASLAQNSEALGRMAAAARGLAHPGAAVRAAEALEEAALGIDRERATRNNTK
jgi:UDP-N-acetylglucosamine--N-acetylmuramyl-(pentapeptide) pyrophosphoryl-undecaprenol N-acetylglucosamine transferase